MSNASAAETRLVGDIGGTNARFGLVGRDGTVLHSSILADADYATIDDAVLAYLDQRGELAMPRRGAIAIASPITGDRIEMTNHPWRFSVSALRDRLGFERLEVINDFTAAALAIPLLGEGDRMPVGGGAAVAHRPIGVIGPGSGLGVSGLIPSGAIWLALTGEGGHSTMAPATHRENAVLDVMRRRYDHVSAERCLSGPGLVNLYNTLTELDGAKAAQYSAAQITDPATAEADPHCRETVEMFCGMLGTVAGNLALTLGAQGGVYIAGGIVPRLGQRLVASPFRERFEAKGRFRSYLAAIPTHVITHPLPAFLGCVAALAA